MNLQIEGQYSEQSGLFQSIRMQINCQNESVKKMPNLELSKK